MMRRFPRRQPVSAGDREQYTVLPGEFLSQIGAKFGMSWLAIVEVNGIRNPDTINAGTVLQIPTAAEAAKYGPAFPVINHPGAHIGVGREDSRRSQHANHLRLREREFNEASCDIQRLTGDANGTGRFQGPA